MRHVSFRLGTLGCVGVVRGKFGQGRRGELGSVGLWCVQIEACYGRHGALSLILFWQKQGLSNYGEVLEGLVGSEGYGLAGEVR